MPGKFRILTVIVFLLTVTIWVFAGLPLHSQAQKADENKKKITKAEEIAKEKEKENKVTKGEKVKKEQAAEIITSSKPEKAETEKKESAKTKTEKIAKEKENTAAVTKGKEIKKQKQKEKEQAEEIIRFSRLKKEMQKFSIDRDIFSPSPMKPVNPAAQVKLPPPPTPEEIKQKAREEKKEKNMEDEIRRTLFFEGYVIRNSNNHALVSINGEFFAVGAGDMVLEKIKIIKIEKKTIKVEVDSKVFEIQLKGDNEDEKQDALQ